MKTLTFLFSIFLAKYLLNYVKKENSSSNNVVLETSNNCVLEMESYMLQRSLKHMEYIDTLKADLMANKSKLLKNDFIEELNTSLNSCKVTVLKTTTNLKRCNSKKTI